MEGGGFFPGGDYGASGGALSVGPFAGDERAPEDSTKGGRFFPGGDGGASGTAPSVGTFTGEEHAPASGFEGRSTGSVPVPMMVEKQRKRGQWKRTTPHIATLLPSGHHPFLPAFFSIPPAQPRESGETREALPPSEPLKLVVRKRGAKEPYEMSKEAKQKQLEENLKHLEKVDECVYYTDEERAMARAFKEKFSTFFRSMANTRPILIYKPPSDTREEVLTAEDMEKDADFFKWPKCPQANHFAKLALEHYNLKKKQYKFEMARVLLSKCFSEVDGKTFAHVNFTASSLQRSSSDPVKRLFFAEPMLIPDLQLFEGIEPMRVLHVCTIDDSCFGGCHEMVRDIKGPIKKDMDYSRCHACSERIKYPRGAFNLSAVTTLQGCHMLTCFHVF